MEGEIEMAYETKVILVALANAAIDTQSEAMYRRIAEMANAEGLVLKPYDEAKKALDGDNAKVASK